MISFLTPCAIATALAIPTPALAQSTDVLDPQRAALVAHLLDRSSRELSCLLADWRAASGGAKAALELEVAGLAAERRAYLAEAAAHTPRAAWASVLDDADRADVDTIAPGNTAQALTVIGELEATCLETEPGIGAGATFFVDDGVGTRWRLRAGLGVLDPADRGAVVEIDGFALDGGLLVDHGALNELVPPSAASPVVGSLHYQVVVVDLQVVNGPLYENYNTAAEVLEFTETNTLNVTDYYDEVSFGQLALTFDYEEMVVTVADPCDELEIREAVIAQLEHDHGDWIQDDYYGLAIFVPWFQPGNNLCFPEANAAFVGPQTFTLPSTLETYTLAYTWLPLNLDQTPQTDSLHTLLHEVGHTLGCMHASTWRAEELKSPAFFCDYGDPFSPMNSANATQGKCESPSNGLAHHNAYHKSETFGWIDAGMIEEVNQLAPSSTYTFELYPTAYSTIGASSANGQRQILKIARGDLGAIWMEYRRAIPGSLYETAARFVDVLPSGSLVQEKGAGFLYVEPVKHRSAMFDPRLPPNTWPDLLGWCLTDLQVPGTTATATFHDDCSDTTITVLGLIPGGPGVAPKLEVEVQTGPDPCLDVEGPKVVMKYPTDGSTVIGTIQLKAEAWDYDTGMSGISEVEFYHSRGADDETKLGTVPLSTAPGLKATATLWVDTHAFPDGLNRFFARAKDQPPGCCPNTGQSAAVRVRVLNESVVPGIVPVAPPDEAYVAAPFTAEADPTPAATTASVEYFFDPTYDDPCGAGELHDGAHPQSCAYHAFFPAFSEHFPGLGSGRGAFLLGTGDGGQPDLVVGSLPPGTYTWWARAISNSGDTALTALRTLHVTGAGAFDVDIPIAENATVSGGATVSIPASVTADPAEAGYVDFFVDDVFLSRDTTAPFTAAWTVPMGTATHVLRADAFGIGGRTATDDVTVLVP